MDNLIGGGYILSSVIRKNKQINKLCGYRKSKRFCTSKRIC